MRGVLGVLGIVSVACTSRGAAETRYCEGALERIAVPRSPAAVSNTLPFAVGDPLPVHRITYAQYDAEDLVDRALAIACAVSGESVEARAEASAWATDALDSPAGRHVRAAVFEPAMDVSVVRWPGGAVDLSVRPSNDPHATHRCDDPPIDRGLALAAAEAQLAEFRSRGLINDVPHRLIHETGPDSHASDICTAGGWVRGFFFEALLGGIPVPGARFKVSVDADGQPHGASTLTFDGEESGVGSAATTDVEAVARFSELAEGMYPSSELLWHFNEVSYPLPRTAGLSEVEPVVYGTFVVKSGNVIGRPQSYTLSLTESGASLVPQ